MDCDTAVDCDATVSSDIVRRSVNEEPILPNDGGVSAIGAFSCAVFYSHIDKYTY